MFCTAERKSIAVFCQPNQFRFYDVIKKYSFSSQFTPSLLRTMLLYIFFAPIWPKFSLFAFYILQYFVGVCYIHYMKCTHCYSCQKIGFNLFYDSKETSVCSQITIKMVQVRMIFLSNLLQMTTNNSNWMLISF